MKNLYMNPDISIITISYNSEKTIEETILSVISQNYENLEYIIIDGGSTDRTLEIIDKYKNNISIIISEEDKGISDAFNKGIKYANGDIIGIINSDDLLAENALRTIANEYNSSVDIYRGNMIIWNDKTDMKCISKPTTKFKKIPLFTHVCHSSTFVTKTAYESYGCYNVNLKYAMDMDLLLRFYHSGAEFKHIDSELAIFRLGGITSSPLKKKKKELIHVLQKNGSNYLERKIYIIYLFLNRTLKRVINFIGEDIRLKLKYKLNK